jgi:hypothetical protein
VDIFLLKISSSSPDSYIFNVFDSPHKEAIFCDICSVAAYIPSKQTKLPSLINSESSFLNLDIVEIKSINSYFAFSYFSFFFHFLHLFFHQIH